MDVYVQHFRQVLLFRRQFSLKPSQENAPQRINVYSAIILLLSVVWDTQWRRCSQKRHEHTRKFESKRMKSSSLLTVSDFMTRQTGNFFRYLGLHIFRNLSALEAMKNGVRATCFINDCAEREVKLSADFNNSIIQSEDEKELSFPVSSIVRRLYLPRKSPTTCDAYSSVG